MINITSTFSKSQWTYGSSTVTMLGNKLDVLCDKGKISMSIPRDINQVIKETELKNKKRLSLFYTWDGIYHVFASYIL